MVASKLSELAETIALRRQKGEHAAVEVVLTDRGKNAMDEARRIMGEMTANEDGLLAQRDQAAKATAAFARSTMIFGGLTILLLVSVAGFVAFQRSITLPLAEFMQFVGRVGEGDLTRQARTSGGDELGEMGERLNQMVTGLKDVAAQTRLATGNLNSSAAEILASTQQQASGTSEQAAAVQQTTTTMEEVTQSSVQISERARQVAASAEAAIHCQPRRSAGSGEHFKEHGIDPGTGRGRRRERGRPEREDPGHRRDYLHRERSRRAIAPSWR